MFGRPLSDPPTLKKDTVRIIPLGGLGDVGRNMTAFEVNGEILIIDVGVLFPEEDHPGVDLILPGFEAIEDRLDDVVGLILTHGHEDHIGAVPYLLKSRPDIPVYGSRLTLAFLNGKLKEHRLNTTVLHEVAEGRRLKVGEQFDAEFVAVNHSIPDALAVFLRTAGGSILHTGDFKMDQLPLDHRLTDLRAFARFGDEGVDLFMVDSTNAEVPGFTTTERALEPAIQQVFERAQGRVIVACFASHVHRVQQVVKQAAAHDRTVVYTGRSMVHNMGIARDLGYLHVPAGTLADMSDADDIPDKRLVIICTGSQGEPMSALARMAAGTHPTIKIGPNDTILLASSLIPGNENAVFRMINGLMRLGARVVHKGNALVHVSGHASSGELLYCYNIVQPKNVLPIHGEPRHLIANAKLAEQTGVKNALTVDDGTVIDLRAGVAKVVGKVDASYILVDGGSVGGVSEESLADRRILGSEGFITVVGVVDFETGEVISVDIQARGFVDDDTVFDPVEPQIHARLVDAVAEGVTDTHALQQLIRRTIGRWVASTLHARPMIVPVVVHT
ncbi:MAG: ribonuclease J [Propionibacteriaceae bacterium]|jgi:ribonuclease J|nr:ribonuclease J [Propionibacteriaceae bacterium]